MEQAEPQPKKSLPAGVDGNTGGRIKQLLESHNLSTYEANQRLGYEKTSKLYKVLKGEVKPSYETLVDLLSAFPEVSAEWLLMGWGSMKRDNSTQHANARPGTHMPAARSTSLQPGRGYPQVLVITVDQKGKENTLLVPVKAQAGYRHAFNEPVYLEQMDPYHLPGFTGSTYRAFEVAGDSMLPSFGHHDIVVCSYVDRWELLKPWESYVIVTAENVLLKRIAARVTDWNGTLELHSDNSAAYPVYDLPVSDILQLWMVRGMVSTNPPGRPDTMLQRLQEVIEDLGHDYHEVRRFLDETAHEPLRPRK